MWGGIRPSRHFLRDILVRATEKTKRSEKEGEGVQKIHSNDERRRTIFGHRQGVQRRDDSKAEGTTRRARGHGKTHFQNSVRKEVNF